MKISSTVGVRGRLLASTRMSIDFFRRSDIDIAEADLGDLRMVHFILQRRIETFCVSTGVLISGSRLAHGRHRRIRFLDRVDHSPLLIARTETRQPLSGSPSPAS